MAGGLTDRLQCFHPVLVSCSESQLLPAAVSEKAVGNGPQPGVPAVPAEAMTGLLPATFGLVQP